MSHWNTKEIVELLKDENWDIDVQDAGGDVDTEQVVITPKRRVQEHFLFINGFVVEGEIQDPTNAEVYYVEVNDGLDSSGGLNSSDLEVALAYAHVVTRLRKAGHLVVPTINDYW